MHVLIATDAWHPQVNGVVRTLTSLAEAAKGLGVSIEFLTHEGFPTIPLPTEYRQDVKRRAEEQFKDWLATASI